MESIESIVNVCNFLKNLFTCCNPIKTGKHKLKDDFQSVLRNLRTLMLINTINGSLDGMRIDVIR